MSTTSRASRLMHTLTLFGTLVLPPWAQQGAAAATMRFASSSYSHNPNAKLLLLLRHGQALHNPRAEAARSNGCSHERFLELMRQDDAFDAPLTDLGETQARQAGEVHGARLRDVELVVSSPLSRALRTADLALPPNPMPPPSISLTRHPSEHGTHDFSTDAGDAFTKRSLPRRVCVEDFREINGWLDNAKRRDRSELESSFHPHWDFTELPSTDETWTEVLESEAACSERGYQGLLWVSRRVEDRVLVVTHGGLLKFAMVDHPNVRLVDGREGTGVMWSDGIGSMANNGRRPVEKRFGNCELREFIMSWSTEDGACAGLSSTQSAGDPMRVNGEENAQRPMITLTEVTPEGAHKNDKEGLSLSQTG